MAIRRAPLNILCFPQRWDGAGTLTLRFVAMPGADPDVALAPGLPTFAALDLALEARVIAGARALPRSADVALATGSGGPGTALALAGCTTGKAAAFAALQAALGVQPRTGGEALPGPRRVLKPVTDSYRDATGGRALSPYMVDGAREACALHQSIDALPAEPARPRPQLRWGEAMALALRQPRLAEALGLIGEADVAVPPGLLAEGGWLFLAPWPPGAAIGPAASLQAAWIPPLGAARPLYAAVLFPVDQDDFPADAPFAEAARYDAGFARVVHAAQERSDREVREGEPHFDSVRLAWDDEQVAEWLNRQTAADAGTPMGTIGYRVDVREAGGGAWHSLQRVGTAAPVRIGDLDLGGWSDQELSIAVAPVRRGAPGEELWLPPYFAKWSGRSLVAGDADLVALHRAAAARAASFRADAQAAGDPFGAEGLGAGDLRFLGEQDLLRAVGDDEVPLRYGRSYEFRVRLADLSHGGPRAQDALPPGQGAIARVDFRRSRPPAAVRVARQDPGAGAHSSIAYDFGRPLLGLPEIRYASGADPLPALIAQLDDTASRERGLPDPHATRLRIRVEVRALAGERAEWLLLYERLLPFPAAPLSFELREIGRLAELAGEIAAEALVLPTRRRLRLTFAAEADEGELFTDPGAMKGEPVMRFEHFDFGDEPALLDPASPPGALRAFLFREPDPGEAAAAPIPWLRDALDVAGSGDGLRARPPVRTVMATSGALAAAPSPDATGLLFGAGAALVGRWIAVLDLGIARDWCWQASAGGEIAVERRLEDGDWHEVGTISLPPSIPSALAPSSASALDEARQSIRALFFDAVATDAGDGAFPAELDLAYRLVARGGAPLTDPMPIRLPVASPPRRRPALVSAGLALSPYQPAADYSATEQRERRVWLEFEEPPSDPGDGYFARIQAHGPDPLLVDMADLPGEAVEPPFRPDRGLVRMVVPGQPADADGRFSMPVRLEPGADGRHWLLPLPEGMGADAPELFGFFTYEIRAGHDDARWCTPHGRWGPPLRVAGVQHPPPPLRCECIRSPGPNGGAGAILIRAPFAFPVHDGRSLMPRVPKTALWAQLYARVRRAHDGAWSNLLVGRYPLEPRALLSADELGRARWGEREIDLAEVDAALRDLGLPPDTPLTALAVELAGAGMAEDPLGARLGQARILRASPLVKVPDAC